MGERGEIKGLVGQSGAKAAAEAGLEGVLNAMPSLGFLHSLQRVLPALERALETRLRFPSRGASSPRAGGSGQRAQVSGGGAPAGRQPGDQRSAKGQRQEDAMRALSEAVGSMVDTGSISIT